jgi:hypothetical protein
MVVVDVADARVFHGREPEARPDGPVVVEAPLADVPVPTRLQLANDNGLLSLAIYRHAPKVPGIGTGFEDGLGGRLRAADSRGDVRAIRLDPAFLEEPVAERPAGIPVVPHVEDGSVGLE